MRKTAQKKTSRSRIGRPRKADVAAVENRILNAAEDLFMREGYAATSIERVASLCESGKDTIYRRYDSKRALFAAVLARCHASVLGRLGDMGKNSSGSDSLVRLKLVMRWLLDVNLEPELVAFKRIAVSELMVGDATRAAPAQDGIMKRLISYVRDAQADRYLRGENAAFLTNYLLNVIVVGPTAHATFGFKPLQRKRDRDVYFEKSWSLFLEGAGAHSSSKYGGESKAL